MFNRHFKQLDCPLGDLTCDADQWPFLLPGRLTRRGVRRHLSTDEFHDLWTTNVPVSSVKIVCDGPSPAFLQAFPRDLTQTSGHPQWNASGRQRKGIRLTPIQSNRLTAVIHFKKGFRRTRAEQAGFHPERLFLIFKYAHRPACMWA